MYAIRSYYVGNEAAEKFKLMNPQPVRKTIKQHGVKSGITEKDLKNAAYCRITIENCSQVFFKVREHAGLPPFRAKTYQSV